MPVVHLEDRALIAVDGEDAETFLQNIITTDLASLGDDEARASALLSPQGKILFDFLVSRAGKSRFRLDCRAVLADDFVRRLMLYKLRAKAAIAKKNQALVAVTWGTDSGSSEVESRLRDSRFPPSANVWRQYAAPLPAGTAPLLEWDGLRIENGVAESGADYTAGDAFPHDVLLDENGGIGFKKGCYIGQEVVSRMQHRGTARRRVLVVSVAAPASGAELLANGRPVGTVGTVAGDKALAIARIDRVKEALDTGQAITTSGATAQVQISTRREVPLPGKCPAGKRLMPDRIGAPPRAWQRMLSGRRLDLLDPSPLDIEISDIAHGLARVARWNGQTSGEHAFTVAQHSLLVEEIFRTIAPQAPAIEHMAALLHDAPEYVIGDMISPFKSVVGGGYKSCEERLQHAIHIRFALPSVLPGRLRQDIKRADQIAAYFEATVLAGFSLAEAAQFFGRPRGFDADRFDLTPRAASKVQKQFLSRFASIDKAR